MNHFVGLRWPATFIAGLLVKYFGFWRKTINIDPIVRRERRIEIRIIRKEQQTRAKMATTHSDYNEKTTATEVASAFADQIRGRNGQS
jgi:hypothetical protein